MVETLGNGVLEAAADLLTEWLPGDPSTGAPAWRIELVAGRTPHDDEWDTAPSLAEIAACGGYPQVLGGRRYPVGVEMLEFEEGEDYHCGQRASAGNPDDASAQVIDLLMAAFEAGPGPLDRRVRPLAGFLAGAFAEWTACEELVRIHVAAEPDGPPLHDEVHVLVRDVQGRARRLTLAPGPAPRDPERRLECAETLLGEFLWMNNNNPVEFETVIEPHGLGLDLADPAAADTAFCAGWKGLGTWTPPDEEGLRRLDGGALAELITDAEEAAAKLALATVCSHEDEGPPDELPELPGDQLVAWLLRDLVGTATAMVAEGGLAPLAYASEPLLPLDGTGGRLMLVGARDVALIDIDDGF